MYSFDERTVRLDPGDWIVFYTDGVTEALDDREQEFGKERLRQVVIDKRGASAAELVAALNHAARYPCGYTTGWRRDRQGPARGNVDMQDQNPHA